MVNTLSIFQCVERCRKLAATNRAPAAAGKNTRTAAVEWRRAGRVLISEPRPEAAQAEGDE